MFHLCHSELCYPYNGIFKGVIGSCAVTDLMPSSLTFLCQEWPHDFYGWRAHFIHQVFNIIVSKGRPFLKCVKQGL
jgi:hypothetical protein